MCLGRFYFEKNQKNANPCAIRVQLQISVPKQTYIFSLDTFCLWYSIKCQTREVPEVICAQIPTTTCTSRHNSRWLIELSLQTIPYMCARLVWVPDYHSFLKWAIKLDGYNTYNDDRWCGCERNECVPVKTARISRLSIWSSVLEGLRRVENCHPVTLTLL